VLVLIKSSFFGAQDGDFSVYIESIKAVVRPSDVEKGFSGTGDAGVRFYAAYNVRTEADL
jgi:hypothetical protein